MIILCTAVNFTLHLKMEWFLDDNGRLKCENFSLGGKVKFIRRYTIGFFKNEPKMLTIVAFSNREEFGMWGATKPEKKSWRSQGKGRAEVDVSGQKSGQGSFA